MSSGSTGEPTVWPRSLTDELGVAARFEQVFADSFAAGERSTLAVVCFPLGTWVGGLYTNGNAITDYVWWQSRSPCHDLAGVGVLAGASSWRGTAPDRAESGRR